MQKTKSRSNANNGEKKDNSQFVWQRSKIDFELSIRTRPDFTEHQKEVIDLILNKKNKVTLISGPAGCGKTMLGLYCALQLLNTKRISKITYSRPMLESSDPGSKLGMLPGFIENKLEPYAAVMNYLLEELLPAGDIKKLNSDERIEVIPVNYIRGLTLSNDFCIFDEVSSFTLHELKTLLSRVGPHSRVICLSDPGQSDLPLNKQGGFEKLIKLFGDDASKEMGINTVYFTEEEIVRSEICKFMVTKFKELDGTRDLSKSPMFES
jgi:phosphate starvation-inducible PhoH-like protein